MADAGSARLDLRDPATLIATCGGVGFVKWAPGSAASLATLPIAWLLASTVGAVGLASAALALFAIGVWAAGACERRSGVRDSPVIVIDEAAGQCVALLPVPPDPVLYAIGFALFRLFDVAKPWPIGPLDRCLKGGFGVMADDAVAGGFAALVLWHVWIWL